MTDLAIQIKPYYIEDIDCEGLSNHDLAECLRADIGNVNRRIKSILSIIPELSPLGIPRTKKGSSAKIYLPTHAAKIVVAKYDNEIGLKYLRFLIACEKIAMEETPKILAQLRKAHERIAELESHTKTKLLDKPKTAMVTAKVEKIDTLFGDAIYKRSMTRVDPQLLTPEERLRAKSLNLRLQAEGCIKKANKLDEQADFLAQPVTFRLIKGGQ